MGELSSERGAPTASLRVIKPGMQTTVQDEGRWGWQASGVPVAGPMDPVSHRMANALAGNPRDAATLEVTLLGPEIEFEDDRFVAVAGADFEITIDGQAAPLHRGFAVSSGTRLRFGRRRLGARAYIAVAGGIAVQPLLGSRSTHLVSGMGGVEGRSLRSGDRLPLGAQTPRLQAAPSAAQPIIPLPDRHAMVRVLAGPQTEYFAPDALDVLQSAPFVVGQDSNRMGFRLDGPRLTHARGADIISDATALGALQVPASGQPILLMADRQTTGGYPKLATVISADIPLAGQLAPSDRVSFVVCTPRTAMVALIAQEQMLMAIEAGRS
ncbi:MAG TPA: biotin-dependent carboxyltransferase family protein [Vicinamibacterales bacterium]